MRDYDLLAKTFRHCGNGGKCSDCPAYQRDRYCPDIDGRINAADAIEELQDQIADVSKTICDLIAYAQKNADESREAEQRHYGSDSTVNVYTWMHNVKRVHERYVAMLDDIAAKLPAPPKGVE